MRFELKTWNPISGWTVITETLVPDADLILCFFGTNVADDKKVFEEIRQTYPKAILAGCSTAGEIFQEEVLDDSLVLLALKLEKSKIQFVTSQISHASESRNIGLSLSRNLPKEGLKLGLIFSLGHNINGTELLEGLLENFPANTPLSGGLAADGSRFEKTYVLANASPSADSVILIGFYGNDLICRTGSFGGWSNFGPIRKITKSRGNVLYELDGKPALELYKKYLGDEANYLPASALRFPLNIFPEDLSSAPVVRTILSINEKENSLTFAGNMPTGYSCSLMTASFENLVEGASEASKMINYFNKENSIALLISCVGRKLVLGQRTSEEIDAVREKLGPFTGLIGFYSYGEIAPSGKFLSCDLHNQTMTITFLSE